jgi:hypothetical protein
MVVMHIVRNKSAPKGSKKIYHSTLLRESYREGRKVKKRTVANLSRCTPGEIAAIELALRYKDDLGVLGSLEGVQLQEGLSVGAVWTIYQVARDLGIDKALGSEFAGKLALWQVMARVIDQGSRLSAVRLAQVHAACDTLGIRRGFDENDLYENLGWLSDNRRKIERKLFFARRGKEKPEIFLYDVTSSYLEGNKNVFGEYGYSRDKKKGKKQIVIGLLCDKYGEPVSAEVFAGNTQDPNTFYSQISRVAEEFGCEKVTFVGDRGMIKSAQIEALPEGFHYITAITKPQIESLIKKGAFQLELFTEQVCEVKYEDVRYILRRNPYRAEEISETRLSKQRSVEKFIRKKNEYLREHSRAWVSAAMREVNEKIKKLKIDKWLKVKEKQRVLQLTADNAILEEMSLLDGCYVIKTDLPGEAVNKQIVHDRYKDLALVEKAFRMCKTVNLEVRPVYVRSEKSTRGHVCVVMLAYMIIRELSRAWAEFDLTVEEGIKRLTTLCSMKMELKGKDACLRIPRPRIESQRLLKALNIHLPFALPHKQVRVVTRKKLPERRKTS